MTAYIGDRVIMKGDRLRIKDNYPHDDLAGSIGTVQLNSTLHGVIIRLDGHEYNHSIQPDYLEEE